MRTSESEHWRPCPTGAAAGAIIEIGSRPPARVLVSRGIHATIFCWEQPSSAGIGNKGEAYSVADIKKRTGAKPMADRSALGRLGFIFSGVAATVSVVAYLVVRDHVQGRSVLDANAAVAGTSTR